MTDLAANLCALALRGMMAAERDRSSIERETGRTWEYVCGEVAGDDVGITCSAGCRGCGSRFMWYPNPGGRGRVNGRRFCPQWLYEARERCMAEPTDAAPLVYSTLESDQLWTAIEDSTALSGRRLNPGEHYAGNYGVHEVDGVTVGTWLS